MDFKTLISKLDSMEAPPKTPAAPVLDKAVQLNEDAQLRVLSGRTSYVAEAKKKAEEDVKEEMKVGDKKASSTGGTIEKTKTGIKHTAGKNYGGDKAPKDDEDDAPKAKKAKKESIDTEAFGGKFAKMVEAKKAEADKKKKKMEEGSKPDFLDMDKDGDKKEPMKKAVADKKGGPKKGVNPFAKKDDDVKESDEMKVGDKKKSSTGGTIEKTATGIKHTGGKNYSGKTAEKEEKSKKDESFASRKKVMAESFEPKLTFKEMVRLVQESGGQQQIDPTDKALFTWAERVAVSKLGEGTKADLYAGLIYERNGGTFEMYDVLSEGKKKVNEGRAHLTEGMIEKVKNVLMSKMASKLSDEEKSKMKATAEKVLGKSEVSSDDFTLANIKAVAKALGAKPEAASESIEEGPMDMIKDAGKKVGDFFGQKKVDPKSGMGTIGSVDAWDKSATLGEKLVSLTGALGGTAAMIAGFFGGPAWLIIPGLLALLFLSQVGTTKGY
jgi:hypothetical protein